MSTEIEYKLELGRMIHKRIQISADEIRSFKDYIHKNYYEKYPLRYRRHRNSVIAVVLFVISFIGTLSGITNPALTDVLSTIPILDQLSTFNYLNFFLLIIMLLTSVGGFAFYLILTLEINSFESMINSWLLENDKLLTKHYILEGILSSLMFDINNISFYNIFLIDEFTKLVIHSRDEIYVSMITLSRSSIAKEDKIQFLSNAETLRILMFHEYLRYRKRKREFEEIFQGMIPMLDPLINRFENKIEVFYIRTNIFNRFLKKLSDELNRSKAFLL